MGSPWGSKSASRHLRTPKMCSTRVAIFEHSGHTAAMPRTSPPTERVVATMALLAERPDALALAGRAHPAARGQQVDRARHPHQPRRRRLGAARPHPQDLPARAGDGGARAGRPAASFPALDFARPALVALSREFAATCAALGVGDDAVTVLDQIADPPRRGRCASASAPRSRCALRSARRWWRGRPTSVRDDWLGHVPARHPRPLRRRARRHPRPRASRSRSRRTPVARVPRARGPARRRRRPPAPRSTASPTSSPTHEEFLAVELDPDRDYAVNVVNAPVFDHTGQVTLVLSLTGFGRALRGTEVARRRRRACVAATSVITDALSPTPARTSRG